MTLTINCEKRDSTGKNAARRIRREGKLPAILYGANVENLSLSVDKKDIFNILKSETGENTLFKVAIGKDVHDVMIKDLQQDVVNDNVLHVDFIQIALDKTIRVTVPVVLVGDAVGVKTEGGFVDFVTREVDIECLPKNIPDNIEVDISDLHLHQSIKVEDAPGIEGVTYATDPQTVLALIQSPVAEEVPAEEEEEEGVMAEEEEPEVVGKEKADSEKESE